MMFRKDVHCRRYKVSIYLLWSLVLLLLVGFRWFWSDDVRTREDVDAFISRKYPLVKNISVEELQSLFAKKSKFYMFDVRDPEEFAVSHLRNAVREVKAEKVDLPAEVLIIAYCSVGVRSAAFVDNLQRHGYQRAYNLKGSLFEWANKGYPMEQSGKNTHKAHPYNSEWGALLDSSLHSYLPDKTGNDL